jgi:malonyl-CoA O-methyltransferase
MSKEFNIQAYNQWSDQYDQMPNSTIAVDDRFFPCAWPHLKGHVLEIGAGTGRNTAKLLNLGCVVTAVEISPGMLAVAREKLAGQAVEFVEGDFLSVGLSGPFDAAITSLVLEHIEDLPAFFRRAASLLRPGGEFYLSEIHPLRIAAGSQANFSLPSGENVQLVSFTHKEEDYLGAAEAAGLALLLNQDVTGDETLSRLHPGWEKYLGKPMIKIMGFRRP